MSRDLDLILLGATGFVGRLTALQLALRAPAGTRIAIAGRNWARLSEVWEGLGEPSANWELLKVDSFDEAALARLAARTTAVVSTVGPYLRYGMPLLAACAQAGTHYADLTGEVLFVREAIDRYHETARGTGARIVPSCGFDSIPSDLTVHLLHQVAGELGETTLAVVSARGGFSGGTIDSLRVQAAAMAADPSARQLVTDPYSLSPDRLAEPDLGPQRDFGPPHHDQHLGWLAPFLMAPYNTRVVRRSNALLGWAYGRGFQYRETVRTGTGPTGLAGAAGLTAGMAAFGGAYALPPTRAVLNRLLPAPGQGPSEETMVNGRVKVVTQAVASDGGVWQATLAAQGDPGYRATSLWLAESGLALALDGDALPDRAGVLTPATALGDVLADRLRAAGTKLSVVGPL